MEKIKVREAVLKEFVERIACKYPESIVLLFGSRARGGELPYSDYDLAIILKDVEDTLNIVENIRMLKPKCLGADIVVLGIKDIRDPIVVKMLNESKILYRGLTVIDS